jgi:hypothetical protein
MMMIIRDELASTQECSATEYSTRHDISRKLLRNSCAVRYSCVYIASRLSYRASARVRRVDYFIRGRHQNFVGRQKNLSSVVQQLLITHRIRYTPCRSAVLSRYFTRCSVIRHNSDLLPQGVPVLWLSGNRFLLSLDGLQRGTVVQGGSNMTGTNCDLFTHKSSRSYLTHLVLL